MQLKASVALAATAALCLGSVAPARGHERRILPANHGSIQLIVGFHTEPAFEDTFSAVDVILNTYDGLCPGAGNSESPPIIGEPIDVNGTAGKSDPDTVNLKVEALYLYKAVPPGDPPVGDIPPAAIERRLQITDSYPLKEAFSSAGTYNSYFRPTHPGDGTNGAYGFHVYGTVHAGPNSATCPSGSTYQLAARTATINSYFVCSAAGSLVPPDAFGCVKAIQPFPGDLEDGYEPNKPYGHRGWR